MSESCRIPLGHGRFALVSAEDFERVAALRWRLKRKTTDSKLYVQHTVRLGSGRSAKKTCITLHRFILGVEPRVVVDHRDGDGLNNQRSNLRICTPRQNAENIRFSKNQKRGGFKGVYWHKPSGKWMAAISAGPVRPNGKRARVHLGLFIEAADAARAYDLQAFKLRRSNERTWGLADLSDLIDELDQIAIRVRRLESAARSEVERLGHWRKLARLGELRSRYLAEKRAVEGCR